MSAASRPGRCWRRGSLAGLAPGWHPAGVAAFVLQRGTSSLAAPPSSPGRGGGTNGRRPRRQIRSRSTPAHRKLSSTMTPARSRRRRRRPTSPSPSSRRSAGADPPLLRGPPGRRRRAWSACSTCAAPRRRRPCEAAARDWVPAALTLAVVALLLLPPALPMAVPVRRRGPRDRGGRDRTAGFQRTAWASGSPCTRAPPSIPRRACSPWPRSSARSRPCCVACRAAVDRAAPTAEQRTRPPANADGRGDGAAAP